jgi:hypothetical protein
MKTVLLFFLSAFSCLYACSQDQDRGIKEGKSKLYDTCWLLDFSVGTNIDMINSSSNPYSKLLGSRSKVASTIGFKLTHLFSKRIGWYANLQMNFYEEKKSQYLESNDFGDFTEALYDKLFWPISILRPSVDAGFVYRIEQDKLKAYPSIGIGYVSYLPYRNSSESETNEDGVQSNITYKQRASSLSLNLGLSVNYYFSEKSFFVLNTSFLQPLQKSYARLTHTVNDIETENISYKTITAGRSLNISAGIGFAL